MAAPATERRILTVVFSDLSGFTALSEHLDPEDVTDIIDGLFRRLRTAIEKHGGTVDKFIGDAVMAVFGAPTAHGDDPLRAVLAGLEMQREIAAFNKERKLDLALRIGINTGEALWGSVAGDRATAMGDAVNLAQRMEALARPGTVLVTRGVERATFRRIEYRPLEAKHVKGRTESLLSFEAAGERAGDGEARAAGFFGREEELARLLEMHGSGGALVAIEGEAGIGKSRLAAELLARVAAASPAPWTAAGRAPEGGKVPLGALADLVRHAAAGVPAVEWLAGGFAKGTSDASRATGAHLLARSVGLDPGGQRLDQLDPAHLADLTRAAWGGWLRGRAPLAIVLDDMENADPALLSLLAGLAPLLKGSRVTIVVTARHGFATPAGFRKLELGPLRPEAVAALAADALGRAVAPGLAQFLLERTGGSPFYAAQLARWLDDEGLLEGTPAALARRPEKLPDGLQALLVARLDALDGDARDAMKTASVFGRSFWRGVLAEVSGRDTARDLATAAREEVVEERPASALPGDAEFSFRQSLIQEAAYSLLTKRDRARLHGAAAAALEARSPAAGRRAKTLAAHQRELEGKPDEAARLWLDAAREALAGKVWDEAASAAREARRLGGGAAAAAIELRAGAITGVVADAASLLALIEGTPGVAVEVRSRALLDCAVVVQKTVGPAEAMALADRALQEVEPAFRLEARFIHIAALALTSRLAEASGEADAFLKEAETDPALAAYGAKIRVQRGLARQRTGRYEEAEKDYTDAIADFRKAGIPVSLAGALRGRGLLLRNRGRVEEALRDLDESLAIFRSQDDRVGLAGALMQRGPVLRMLGRRAESLESVREAAALSREMGLRTTLASSLSAEGNVHSEEGNVAEARRCWSEALEIARSAGDRAQAGTILSNLGSAAATEGDYVTARRMAEEALVAQRELGGRRLVIGLLAQIGEYDLHDGDGAAARAKLDEAMKIADELGIRAEEGLSLIRLAQARRLTGDDAGSRAAAEEALGYARRPPLRGPSFTILTTAAHLEAQSGRTGAAAALYEEAIRLAEEAGLPKRAEEPRKALAKLRGGGA